MDLKEVEISFGDCTALLMVSDIQTLGTGDIGVDGAVLTSSHNGVLLDVDSGSVTLGNTVHELDPGRYLVWRDGLYRRVQVEE